MAAILEFDREGLNTLVRQAQAGDPEAAVEAVDRCRPLVERIARRRGLDCHTTDDMLQDLRILTTRKIGSLAEPEAFTGWIGTVASRWRADRRKHAERTFDPQEPFGALPAVAVADDPTTTAIRRENALLVARAVERLPALHREPIQMFFFERLSIVEIASRLGVPEGTIKSRLHHGKQRLAALLPARLAA